MSRAKITFQIRDGDVHDFLTSPSGPVWKKVEQLSSQVADMSKRLCPSDSGHLRGSIYFKVAANGNLVIGTIGTHLPYGVYIHEGTGIWGSRHAPITPTHAKFLRFKPGSKIGGWGQMSSGGGGMKAGQEFVFARSVKGVFPNPFLYRAMVVILKGWPVKRKSFVA